VVVAQEALIYLTLLELLGRKILEAAAVVVALAPMAAKAS
jgi:hypothetical protein